MTEKKNYYIYKWDSRFRKTAEGAYRVTVSIRDLADKECREALQALRAAGTQVCCALPVLWRSGQGPAFEEVLPEIDGWYAGNIGQIRRLLETGKPVYGDAGLNVFNEETAAVLMELGLSGATWSYELEDGLMWAASLTAPEREAPRGKSQAGTGQRGSSIGSFQHEILRSGRVPAMVSEYCPLAGAEGIRGSSCGRCREENPVWLKDFKGERYPVLLEPDGCTSLILSRRPLDRPWAEQLAETHPDIIQRICLFD